MKSKKVSEIQAKKFAKHFSLINLRPIGTEWYADTEPDEPPYHICDRVYQRAIDDKDFT